MHHRRTGRLRVSILLRSPASAPAQGTGGARRSRSHHNVPRQDRLRRRRQGQKKQGRLTPLPTTSVSATLDADAKSHAGGYEKSMLTVHDLTSALQAIAPLSLAAE